MQAYSDPNRETEPTTLPDIEVFYVDDDIAAFYNAEQSDDYESIEWEVGYYYWFCFPRCLPDSLPIGPFDTEQEATAHAQSEAY
jgi:hypothetical protein